MKRKTIAPLHYFYDHPRDSLPETIPLEKDFALTKFNHELVDLTTAYFTELYSGHDIQDLKNCKYCLTYDYEVEDRNAPDAGQIKIHRFIESLRITRPTRSSSSTFVFEIDNQGNFIPHGASQKSSTVYLVDSNPGSKTHFVTQDAEKIKRYYIAVDKLYDQFEGKYNRVLNAFIFFQLGYLAHYSKLRVVPFVTALESLFNTSEQEVGYSLRIRCSAFLGNDQEEKEILIKKLKAIYNLRSSAVHGSMLPKEILRDPNYGNRLLIDLEEICRLCLQKIFDQKLLPIFSQNNEKVSQYLDALVVK